MDFVLVRGDKRDREPDIHGKETMTNYASQLTTRKVPNVRQNPPKSALLQLVFEKQRKCPFLIIK